MKLYLDNGYLNMKEAIENTYPFLFVVGARATGKTYGALQTILNIEKKFILLRLTQAEVDLISSDIANPFKSIPGASVEVKKVNKYMGGFYKNNKLIGVCMAVTTFANTRGADLSDFEYIILDEFIPEKHVKKIQALGEALKNIYETVNRNRELQGRAPVKLVAMANSLNLNNDILISFGLVDIINKMNKKKLEIYTDAGKGLMMIYPRRSPISSKKEETALYRLEGKYSEMALKNEFREFFEGNIRSMNFKNFKPYVIYDDMCIYRSTQAQRRFYVSSTRKGAFNEIYSNTDYEAIAFKKKHFRLYDYYIAGNIIFEHAELELAFCNLFKICR